MTRTGRVPNQLSLASSSSHSPLAIGMGELSTALALSTLSGNDQGNQQPTTELISYTAGGSGQLAMRSKIKLGKEFDSPITFTIDHFSK